MEDLYLQILGPLRVWRGGVELDTGPRQQSCLLALLLARAGKPISTHELIDLIWGEDVPATALNILQKYVGTLRRLLEPARPARGPGSYLQRRGNGYLFAAAPGMVDIVTFRELVEAAKAGTTPDAALDHYARALGLWHGTAGDGLAPATASSIFAALDAEFFDACVAAADLAVSHGQPGRVLPSLHLAARMAPLHETVQAALVSALGAAGRTAEALSVVQAVRARLDDELGIDPGPALLAAHQRALRQPPPAEQTPAAGLVGRAEELTVLRHAVTAALGGGGGLVVIEGEPGVGKTRLLEEIAAEANRLGALVVWGRCLDGDGTPSMWPWVQAVGTLLDGLPAAARAPWNGGDLGRLLEPRDDGLAAPVLPDTGARFRLFERTVALTGQISARRPLVLVIDDLQWADVASLQMFGHLAARLPNGIVIIGALRDRAPAPGSELARMLAAASRLPHHRRLRLGPLGPAEVAELVRREIGREPGRGAARSIHTRTGGNPFFVRELSRFLAGGGPLTEDAAARAGVPATVRDIVRDRMAGLDDDARDLVGIAALIGRDVELGLLARAAGIDSQNCLERLEPLADLGMLEPAPGDPFAFRFTHDLVRESVVRATAPPRATRLHQRIADALEHTGTDDESVAERLAHHLWAAGPLADPARTAAALVDAGRRAAAKSAFEAAEQQVRSAAQLARTAGLAELELSALAELAAVSGMRSGYVGSALDQLERAEQLARRLGREREAADFLFSRWAAYSQGIRLDRAGRLARRLLDEGEASTDPLVRAYGRHAWGIHQWDVGNIGAAFRYLSRTGTMLDDPADGGAYSLRRDLRLLWPVMRAMMTALHGDVEGARAQLDTVETGADGDPYVITVWAAFSVTIAALAGHPAWARRAANRGIAVDPEATFVFLGAYQRLGRCWARATSVDERAANETATDDPAAAASEAEQIIAATLLDPPRSGVVTWYGLLAEMWLAAGRPAAAAAALDRADALLDAHGQRYAEGFLLLMRARLARARGEPESAVRSLAESARALSVARGAHLFARRAEELAREPHASRVADRDGE